MKGWILSAGPDGQKLYRLEHQRHPFAVSEQMLYRGPGASAPAAWGQTLYNTGQKTLAWTLASNTVEDREMTLLLLPLMSQFLSGLRSDLGYFFSDDLLAEIIWEMQAEFFPTPFHPDEASNETS